MTVDCEEEGLQKKSASEVLRHLVSHQHGEEILSLFELKDFLHERGFALLMLLFALPLSIPLPVPPGVTTVFSMPLLFLSAQLLLGYSAPWLPKWLGKKSFKLKTLKSIIDKALPLLKSMEKLTHPRFQVFSGKFGEVIYGSISLICSISIAMPLPLTNFIPAAGIVLMSLGVMSKDGLMFVVGLLTGFFGLFVTSLVLMFGPQFVIDLYHLVKNAIFPA